MKKIFLILIFFATFTVVSAQQNLVPNYSFENSSTCPNWGCINDATGWFQPNKAGCASNIFNTCQGSYPDVPNCYSGYQWPHTGNAFAGVVLFHDTVAGGYIDWDREYLEIQLTDSLKANKKYCVGFYVNKGNWSDWAIKNIQAAFTHDSLLYYDSNYGFIPGVTIAMESQTIIYDSVNWVKVRDIYSALGTEKFLTVGDFSPGNQVIHHLVFPNTQVPNTNGYYLFDDISVYEQPDVFAGNDTLVHPGDTAHLGMPGRSDIMYSWSPTIGLSNSTIANPIAHPSVTTQYILTVTDTNTWACNSIMKDTVLVTVGFASVDSQINSLQFLRIYPNPNNGSFSITAPQNKNVQIEVCSSIGEVVQRKYVPKGADKTISVSGLDEGIYFVKVIANGNVVSTQKVIVTK